MCSAQTPRGRSSCVAGKGDAESKAGHESNDLHKTSAPVPNMETDIGLWIGGKTDRLSMVYVSGDDPWEVYLSYKNGREELQSVEEDIEDSYTKGALEKSPPIVGKVVACRSRAQNRIEYFRGLILKYNPKARGGIRNVVVYKLDYGTTSSLFAEDVFRLPQDLARFPSRVVKCRLLDDEYQLKERFCKELRLAFKDVLQNSVLTVDLGKRDGSQPPIFSAVVWTFDADKCAVDINLNFWLNGKVIPRLKDIPPEESNVFVHLREQEIMDPYYGADKTDKDGNDDENNDDDADLSELVGEHLSLHDTKPKTASECPPPAASESDSDSLGELSFEKLSNDFHPPTVGKSGIVTDIERANSGLHSPPDALECRAVDSTAGAEFVPCGVVVVSNGSSDDIHYDGVATNLMEEYQPKDEKRICWFYQKNGYCGRKRCDKEHVAKSSLWTTDMMPIYIRVFNDLCLPEVGSEVLLKIQHLTRPTSFYVNLPDSFSDTGEPGVLETSETLHADLNSRESNNTHRLLEVNPQEAELVLALGKQDSLGPMKKWLRGRVMEVLSDTHVLVFFLDFGNKEVVKVQDLRTIRPQFLHLPPQAVLTRLYKLLAFPEKKEILLSFLYNTIVQKELKAKVISQESDELDVELYLEDGVCLNDLLLREGLVYEI